MRLNRKPDLDLRSPAEIIFGLPPRPGEPVGPVVVVPSLDSEQFVDLLNKTNAVSMILRRWVDEWLDSGRTQDGLDDPRARNFNFAPHKVGQAAYEFIGNIRFVAWSQNLELWFPDAFKAGPVSLLRASSDDIAKEKLVVFLLSGLRFKLAKCRREGCGRYFVLKHWKRPYKRGTYCSEHQRSRSLERAAQATAEDRRRAEETLYQLAAKKFRRRLQKSDNWYLDSTLSEQIIRYLNSKINANPELFRIYRARGRAGITKKWLGWAKNRRGIENAATSQN